MVEAIPKTGEAIAAGVVGGDGLLLLHFKFSSGGAGVSATVKASKAEIGEKVAEFLGREA